MSQERRNRGLLVVAQAMAVGVVAMVSVEMNLARLHGWGAALVSLEIAALLAFIATPLWRWSKLMLWWMGPELVLVAMGPGSLMHQLAWSMWVLTVLALNSAVRGLGEDRPPSLDDDAHPLPEAVARLDSVGRPR